MTEELIVAAFPVFKALPGALEDDRSVAVKEAESLFEEFADRVSVRGNYSTSGFRADADLVFWWVAKSAEDLQDLTTAFRKTQLGRALQPREYFVGIVRPAEFTKDHQPAFVKGEAPKKFLCVYPFVRTPE